MAFENDAYATVWEVKPVSDAVTKVKITTRMKKHDSDEYETDFSSAVSFVGTANAHQALSLQPKDRIKLVKVRLRNKYDKEKKVMYWNPIVIQFEMANGTSSHPRREDNTCPQPSIDDGEVEDPRLPF